jgi:NAD(P)-dependent dehydrogenase (short-subunit alcohol dehydrogenase family)
MTPVVAIADPTAPVGRANARTYADAGWNVALIGRGWDGLEAAAADVRARGREALVIPVDITDPAARALAIERVQAELGPIREWAIVGERAAPTAPVGRRPKRVRGWVAGLDPVPTLAAAGAAAAAGIAVGLAAWSRRR